MRDTPCGFGKSLSHLEANRSLHSPSLQERGLGGEAFIRVKNLDISFNKILEIKVKNTCCELVLQLTENQMIIKRYTKRCLLRLQKGVSKGLKGHLLQAKRASLRSQKSTSRPLSD